ncbi:MAG: InlB B-repeat-containing protein, partial [Acholeplasmataceae bacterium]
MNRHLYILIIFMLLFLSSCQDEDVIETYEVTYYDASERVLERFTGEDPTGITEPEAPNREGYTFLYWEKTARDDQRTIRYDPVYRRERYRMSFVTTGGTTLEPRTYDYDEPVEPVPTTEKEGYDFLGWYLDPEFEEPFSATRMPAQDLILYAEFDANTYRLDFAYEGIDPVVRECDELIGELPVLERTGYTFNGWYVDEARTERFDEERMPASDLTLYPGFDARKYAILLDPGNGESEVHDSLHYRDQLPTLPEPTREGYEFIGWFIGETPYDRNETMPAENLHVTAKWRTELDFVDRKEDQLYLKDEPFRFASFNVPNLHVLEDPNWHMVEAFEQEDAIRSVQAMGGRVIRTYTLSVVGGIRPGERDDELAHIMGPETYHEELFRRLDRALELANEYGIRLIIPFIDEWEWFGGVSQFSALYGKDKADFFDDEDVKDGFKHLIDYVLNRKNVYTGVRYK